MASDKAKATSASILAADLLSEAPKGMSISEADAQTATLIDAAVAPLLDLLDEYRLEDPDVSWDETICRTEVLLRSWGRS